MWTTHFLGELRSYETTNSFRDPYFTHRYTEIYNVVIALIVLVVRRVLSSIFGRLQVFDVRFLFAFTVCLLPNHCWVTLAKWRSVCLSSIPLGYVLFETSFEYAHLLFDFSQPSLRRSIETWGNEVTLTRDPCTITTWLSSVTPEFSTSTFQTGTDDAVTTTNTRMRIFCFSFVHSRVQ